MPTAYLGLGSNEGNRPRHLRAAAEHLYAHDAVRSGKVSPVYETEAHTWGPDEEQPPFLNAVVRIHVDCEPEMLLQLAQAVEQAEGRTRTADRKWQPRPLDVDLLAVGRQTRQTEDLILPHPRLSERRFVLRPWADLAPNFIVPVPFDQSVQALLDQCPDEASVHRTDAAFGEGIGRGVPLSEAASK